MIFSPSSPQRDQRWILLLLAIPALAGAMPATAQVFPDPCSLFPWDVLPAPFRDKERVLRTVDLDDDGEADCSFLVNSDRVSTTYFTLSYSATRNRCAVLAARRPRVGFSLHEWVGIGDMAAYASPGTGSGLVTQIQTWMDICQPDPYGCFVYADPNPAREFSHDTIAYVGMRLVKADGNHFGWVKFSRPCNKPWVILELESYALHPLPNTPIPAGVVPQPELVVERGPGTVTLSWRPEWQGYRLEWLQILAPTIAWKPVEGVVNNRVTLPANALTAYFRLAKEP